MSGAIAHLSVDIETYSSEDITTAGLYRYVQAPDYQIMLLAYAWQGEAPTVLDLLAVDMATPEYAILCEALQDPQVVKHAYNAAFEWYGLSKHLRIPDPRAWLAQWRCTMLHGLYCGYPGSLDNIGVALGLKRDKQKLASGKALMKLFCTPGVPKRTNGYRVRTLPVHEPEKWELFKRYNAQDVIAEMAVEDALAAYPVPESEQRLWRMDQDINAIGVRVDLPLVDGALYCRGETMAELTDEAQAITGLDNPNSTSQLMGWLAGELDEIPEDMTKATVARILESDPDSDAAQRMLEIRQETAKTSVKKYDAIKGAVCTDGRIRGAFQFYGANRTGRWAGRLVQLHNLPQNHLPAIAYARELVKAGDLEAVRLVYGNVTNVLSQLIRTAFIPSKGRTFLVADFSAIEARVIAWLADEQWRQEVFRTHGKIYEASASAMFGIPLEQITKELRQKGKIAELALGYQGAKGALITMGALDKGLKEEDLPEIVQRWRGANPRIVDLWYRTEAAAMSTMETGRPVSIGHSVTFARENDDAREYLTIQLPAGRKLFYAQPFTRKNSRGFNALYYQGTHQKTRKWQALDTYGGKLVENCVQAIARDCLALAMKRLTAAGYRIVMHVHDEVVLDASAEDPFQEEVLLANACRVMGEPIDWAPGLLLRAAGFQTEFYMKDD